MSLATALAAQRPDLRKKLLKARIDKSPVEVVEEAIRMSVIMTLTMLFILGLVFWKADINMLFLLIAAPLLAILFYNYRLLGVKAKIIERRKEIDKDVLFAGRYLLVKLNSGQPLINALTEAANSYGMANRYLKEIVRDINLGKPVEEALEEAAKYSPSDNFRKIVFQISNAMKIGIDVTDFLEATLEEISEDQILEIKRYGKKLNSLTLFYLLLGIVLPSLGMTMLTILFSLIDLFPDLVFFGIVLVGLTLLQVVFLIAYRNIRPNLNI